MSVEDNDIRVSVDTLADPEAFESILSSLMYVIYGYFLGWGGAEDMPFLFLANVLEPEDIHGEAFEIVGTVAPLAWRKIPFQYLRGYM